MENWKSSGIREHSYVITVLYFVLQTNMMFVRFLIKKYIDYMTSF